MQHLCSLARGQIILSASCFKGTPRFESQGFFCLLFGFEFLWSRNKSLSVIKRIALFSDSSVKSASPCLI